MKFIIQEENALGNGSLVPLVEEYDMDDMTDYASYLSTVMINGVCEHITYIGSGVCIRAVGSLKRGPEGIEEMKEMSPVFREALRMAIERNDINAPYFQKILDDYDANGICMPMMDPFFEEGRVKAKVCPFCGRELKDD